ncbi:HD domain-containing protein, partial [Nonomuraea terrae]
MFPETPAAAAALSVARRFCSSALLNHCLRSYLWGAMYATAHGIDHDDELYYVSALLHDIALTETFDSHTVPFEEAGGRLGWVFGV